MPLHEQPWDHMLDIHLHAVRLAVYARFREEELPEHAWSEAFFPRLHEAMRQPGCDLWSIIDAAAANGDPYSLQLSRTLAATMAAAFGHGEKAFQYYLMQADRQQRGRRVPPPWDHLQEQHLEALGSMISDQLDADGTILTRQERWRALTARIANVLETPDIDIALLMVQKDTKDAAWSREVGGRIAEKLGYDRKAFDHAIAQVEARQREWVAYYEQKAQGPDDNPIWR